MVEPAQISQTDAPFVIGESISPEEVLELGLQLNIVKSVPEKALKLLKILDSKAITGQLLIDTKIGKSLTAVSDKPDPIREIPDDPELLRSITIMKDSLKTKWLAVH